MRDEYNSELCVTYTFGPQFGRRLVTHADLEQLGMAVRALRRAALDHLEVLSSRAEFHGQPPALMLSFDGLESSLVFATDFWTRLSGALPGELVIGVPARDVVIVTGSKSQAGLEKARRCVDRVFFAGGEHLITRTLLVRRGAGWEPFDRPARPSGRPGYGPAHQHGVGQPPRQYQEHPSWPSGERVSPMRPAPGRHLPPGQRPLAARMGMTTTGFPAVSMAPGGPVSMAPIPMSAVPAAPISMAPIPMAPVSSGPVSMVPNGPISMAPIPMAPVSSVPQQRPRGWRQHLPQPEDIAPFSAVPCSAVPYSAVPNSGSLYSLSSHVPPYSAMPYGEPYAEPYIGAYRDDGTASGYLPRVSAYEGVGAKPGYGHSAGEGYAAGGGYAPERRTDTVTPAYPASWGAAPSAPPSKSGFRTGPRARFAR